MKKKPTYLPKPVLKGLAGDIEKLINTNEGRIFILEVFEEIPFELRQYVLEGLSSFHTRSIAVFFYLLKEEYGKEIQTVCKRAIEKLGMAGVDITPPEFFAGSFYRAYASVSRHTGRVSLDIAWDTGSNKGLHVECFYLTFNGDGIHSFFIIDEMPVERYEEDRESLSDMVEISFDEVCYLVSQAYTVSIRSMNRVALGRFLFSKYIDSKVDLCDKQKMDLMRRISAHLTPRQLVNSFFSGLQQRDYSYISSLLLAEEPFEILLNTHFNNIISSESILLEAKVEEVYASQNHASVTGYIISASEKKVFRRNYKFHLNRDNEGYWTINDIIRLDEELINQEKENNPFTTPIYCRVYEIIDIDELFDLLDRVDHIKAVKELPYGIHLQITYYEDELNHGISMFNGVIADLVINGNEFVVLCREKGTLGDLNDLLLCCQDSPVVCQGEYEINLVTAYNYLGGQYINFEDILINNNSDFFFEDGMRFISVNYYVKDWQEVFEMLNYLDNCCHKSLQDGTEVFYQFYNKEEDEPDDLFAEYVLGPDWLTLSAFGDTDMSEARHYFESSLYDYLEFDGMEIKEEGIFDILSPEIKKAHPEMESFLKEMYLNKWFKSCLRNLCGMSPREAIQSNEGKRLLWTMFKKIRQKETQRFHQGIKQNINLKEYIHKVEQRSEKNIKKNN